jgi:hypothetical protein
MAPKRTRSCGGGVGSGAGSSGSVRRSRSTSGRDGSGVEQEARRGQGGSPESGSWAGGSGQDGEVGAAASRMKKRLAADTTGRGGAGQSVHTSVVCLPSDWGVHPASQPGVPSDECVL